MRMSSNGSPHMKRAWVMMGEDNLTVVNVSGSSIVKYKPVFSADSK